MIQVRCNLCGADEWQMRFAATMNGTEAMDVDAFRCTNPGYGHHPQIVECVHCGYIYANPRWSEDELLAAYSAVEDTTYLQERAGRELTFRKHLQALEKVIGPANGRTMLDVGAYIGVFVEIATAAGWCVYGIEPSEWAANVARQQGLNVIPGTLDSPELQGQRFDVITMWDVIEHVADPSAELAKAYHLLNPQGWLVVHTMDIDSLTARLMGRRWPWLMDMHIHYFSQKTLAKMVQKNGFKVIWSGPQGRYLSLGYLATRVQGLNCFLGRLVSAVVKGLRLEKVAIPINLGDLFTVYAQRP